MIKWKFSSLFTRRRKSVSQTIYHNNKQTIESKKKIRLENSGKKNNDGETGKDTYLNSSGVDRTQYFLRFYRR